MVEICISCMVVPILAVFSLVWVLLEYLGYKPKKDLSENEDMNEQIKDDNLLHDKNKKVN